MKKVIIGIVALVLVGGGVWFFGFRDSGESEETHTHEDGTVESHDTTDESTTDTDQNVDSEATMITYTDGGFDPDSYTVAAGSTVTVQNNSSSVLDFASGDHPTHLDNPELNAGEIAAGSSKTFTLTEKGTWSIHNHENDAHEATIVVE